MISPAGQNFFLAYNQRMLNEEILLWFTDNGTILREDTVTVPYVEFSFVDNMQGKLVTYTPDPWTWTETFCVHSYLSDGSFAGTDTLLVDTVQSNQMHGGHTYDFWQGTLTLATSIVRTDVSPLIYTLRVVRYSGGAVTSLAQWEPAPLPVGSRIQNWSVTHAPGGAGVLGFYVRDDNNVSELRFEGFDAAGLPADVTRVIALPPTPTQLSANGLNLLVDNDSVYPLFTLNASDSSSSGGVFLAAFPLSDILAAREHPQTLPQSFKIMAYPNPFNSSVRIDYQFPVAGRIALDVFDLTGRLVSEQRIRNTPSAHGTVLWSAEGLPSGTYLARLRGGNRTVTTKLLLIR